MRRRLAITVFAATAMVVIAFVVPLGYLVRRVAEDRAVNAATAQARAIGPTITGQGAAEVRAAIESARRDGSEPITVVLPDGEHVGSTRPVDPAALRLARRGDAFVRRLDQGVDVYQPVVTAGGSTGVVVVHVSESRMHDGVLGSWLVLGALGLVLSSGALVLADRIARSATRPLADVATVARRLASGEEDARAGGAGPPEVRAVAHALNLLADRVDELRAADREQLADLSHDLRTPITALRLDVELLGSSTDRDRLVGDVERLEAAVSGLIATARRGRDATLDSGPADLAAITRARLSFWSVAAGERTRLFAVAVPPEPVWVGAAPGALTAVVDALVANAVQHTPSDTAISVSLVRRDRWAELVVDDAGPGFPSSAVVERGVRGSDGSGTGLGLDIARRTATEAGGRLTIGRASLGGARVAMHLPVVAAPAVPPSAPVPAAPAGD